MQFHCWGSDILAPQNLARHSEEVLGGLDEVVFHAAWPVNCFLGDA